MLPIKPLFNVTHFEIPLQLNGNVEHGNENFHSMLNGNAEYKCYLEVLRYSDWVKFVEEEQLKPVRNLLLLMLRIFFPVIFLLKHNKLAKIAAEGQKT